MSYAFREAVSAFRRAPLLMGLSAAMVGLALLVVGLFGLAAHNLRVAFDQAERRVEVVAYLRDDARVREVDSTQEELLRLPEVSDVRFVSKGEALEAARRDLPEFEEVFSDLAVNPLPASLEIELASGSRTQEAVSRVAQWLEAYPIVEDVTYGREWVDRLFQLRRLAGVAAGVLGVSFALVAALIIGTALRIAIFARRDEIHIMRLVGARSGFIRRPFLLEGGLTGLFGGLFALLLTFVVYSVIYQVLFELEWIPWPWVAIGIASGVVFGVLASAVSVRRHLQEV